MTKIEPNKDKNTMQPSVSFKGYTFQENEDTDGPVQWPDPIGKVSLTQLFSFADGWDILLMVTGTICALAMGAIFPLFTILFGDFMDAFNDPSQLGDTTATLAVNMVYVGIGALVAFFGKEAFWNAAAERQAARIREEYLSALLRQDIAFFDFVGTGKLTSRIANDTLIIQEAIGEKVGTVLQLTATFVGGFIVGFVKGWELTLFMLAFVPFLAIAGAFMTRLIAKFSQKGLEAYADAGAVAQEVLSAVRTVASFGAEKKELARYSKNLKQAKDEGVKKAVAAGVGLGLTMFMLFATYAGALWFGGFLVSESRIGGGSVLIVFFSVLISAFSIGQAGPNMESIASGQGAAYKMFDTIHRYPEIDCSSDEGEKPDKVLGNIELSDISFRYPSRPKVPIFKRIQLSIKAGQKVALVGPSGAGKSSIVALLERFYDPIKGKVLLDGRDLSSLNVKWLRQQIGLVSQEPVLFLGTIADNIRFGKPDATMEEVQEAAKQANAHKFIMKFPDGYNTQVGEKGAQLSGGQKQRIAIARAIIKNPKILLLDEATSALDSESEKVVQQALDSVMKGRTTIVIAHRLSTIRDSDVIAVINKGKVAELGTHDELLSLNGIYADLVKLQGIGTKAEPVNSKVKARDDDEVLPQQKPEETETDDSKDKKKKKKSDVDTSSVSMGRLLSYNKKEILHLIFGCLGAGINGAINPVFAVVFGKILAIYFLPDKSQILDEILPWGLGFIGLAILAFLANLAQAVLFGIAGEQLTKRLRKRAFEAMLRQEVGWFDEEKHSTGVLTAQLASDATLVQGIMGANLRLMVQNIVTVILGVIIAFIYGWELTLVVLACSPLLVLSGAAKAVVMKGFKKTQEDTAAANQVATEAISNIRTVASFTYEKNIVASFRALLERPNRLGVRRAIISGFLAGVSQFVSFGIQGLVLWYGGTLIEDGTYSFQDVMTVILSIFMSAMGLGQSSAFAPNVGKARVAAAEIFEIIDRVPPIDSSSTEGESIPEFNGEIVLKNVDFTYPTRPESQVLHGLSISAKPGKVVALVGQSGCGKSSIVALIQRFYDPQAGRISVDKKKLSNLNVAWLRKQIGIVSQEPTLFSGSIADNIRYGKDDATDEEVEAAAKAANAHKFITGFPDGYNTQVGEKGAQLSGGQKQRIAIARAIIRNPKILLLDEATSALDSESEKVVQKALDSAMQGRTTVVIAHRLSTIQNADCIAVIHRGQVIEMGTHEELVKEQGVYYHMHSQQTR